MDGGTQRSPWLDIPLADYEGHMSLPEIGQAQMIADFFASLLKERSPASVAVMGCSGGNGFDRIDPSVTTRVVGVDLNPAYVRRARKRFSGRFDRLELYTCDIQAMDALFEPVDMVYAALVFEYLDPPASAVVRMAAHLRPGGVLATIL